MEPLEPTPEADAVAPHEVEAAVSVANRIGTNIRRAVKVSDDVVEHVIVSLLAEGHILVEDYPGVGKTALARALSRSIDCAFARVQCTADLLPADIVGTNVYNQREGRFEFRPGPIFANIVIVDEINRASPKTQSGLLECMQERQVTVDATSHELARPFLVFATQNPVEYEGTYPLPEAQVDRFMVRLSLGYPNAEDEASMLAGHEAGDRVLSLEAVADRAEVVEAVEAAHRVHASRALRDYIVALLRQTRDDGRVELGASPRAGLMLLRAAKARALVNGRDHALPDDVQALADRGARAPADAGPGGGRASSGGRSSPTPSPPPRRSRRTAVRSAFGCAALGLLLLVVAGTFDAEPLYVTGAALDAARARRRDLDPRRGRRRVRHARARPPQRARGAAARAAHPRPRRPPAAAAGLDRRAAAARADPLPRRPPRRARARRGHVRPPRPPPARAARARAARPVRARPARRDRRVR